MSNADKPSEFLSIFNAANFFNDLADYLTKTLAAKLYQRKDQMFLYATNFNPTFTGFVNMTNATSVKAPSVAHTVDDETVATTYYVGDRVEVELQNYTPTSVIQNTYAPKNNPTFTGTVIAPTPTTSTPTTLVATVGYVVTYVTNALTPYLTQANAASTYQTIANMVNYLTASQIQTTYLTITNAISTYAPLISPTFTGLVNMVGATSVTAPILSYVHPVSLSNDLVVTVGYLINYFTGELAIELSNYNTSVLQTTYAPINNPTFTGSVNAPTPSSSSSTLVATTQYVANELANYTTTSTLNSTFAPLHSPSFTGSPTGTFPTKPIPGTPGYNQNELATLGYVNYIIPVHYFPNPTLGNGGGTVNMSGAASILMGGVVDMATAASSVTAPTVTSSDNSTKVATTAFVKDQLTDTVLTGAVDLTGATSITMGGSVDMTAASAVTAPTLQRFDNTTNVATTAFVQSQFSNPTFTNQVDMLQCNSILLGNQASAVTAAGTVVFSAGGTVTSNGSLTANGSLITNGSLTTNGSVDLTNASSVTSSTTSFYLDQSQQVATNEFVRNNVNKFYQPFAFQHNSSLITAAKGTKGAGLKFTPGNHSNSATQTKLRALGCYTFRITANLQMDPTTNFGIVTNAAEYFVHNGFITGTLIVYPARILLSGGSQGQGPNQWGPEPVSGASNVLYYTKNQGGNGTLVNANQWTDIQRGVFHWRTTEKENTSNFDISDHLYIYGYTSLTGDIQYMHFGCRGTGSGSTEISYQISVELLSASGPNFLFDSGMANIELVNNNSGRTNYLPIEQYYQFFL